MVIFPLKMPDELQKKLIVRFLLLTTKNFLQMSGCNGIKKDGLGCKNKGRFDGYCGRHLSQKPKIISTEAENFMLKHKGFNPIPNPQPGVQNSGWNQTFLDEILWPIAVLLFADFKFNPFDQNLVQKLLNFIVFSSEPQEGKTNIGMVLIWVYRFIHGNVPIFIVDKLNDNKDQFDGRIKKFNADLHRYLKIVLAKSSHFSKSQFGIIYEIIQLREIDAESMAKQIKKEKVSTNLYQRLGFVPRAICNIARLGDMLKIIKYIAGTCAGAALIIDELHSLITDSDLEKPIIRALDAIKTLVQRPIVGITATPAAVVFHGAINEYFSGIMSVEQADFYKKLGLVYRGFNDFNQIKISQFSLNFSDWSEELKTEFKELLTQILNRPHFDRLTHLRRIQKLFAIIGPDKNDEQAGLEAWINAEFKEDLPDGTCQSKFQTYVLNQHADATMVDFLNNSDDIRPIIIIGRFSMAQGLTIKPTDAKKLAICPGISDLHIIHSKTTSHDESNIQKLRGNGWHPEDLPKLNLYLSERDRRATEISIKNNNLIKHSLMNEIFSPQRTIKDHLSANCPLIGNDGHRLTRRVVTPILKDITELSHSFDSLEKAMNYVKKIPEIQYETLESYKFNLNFSDNGILGDCHDPATQSLLRKQVAKTIREKFPALVGDLPVDRIQGAYSESRETSILKYKINPQIVKGVYWFIRVSVGSPQQSMSNLTCIIYKKYKPEDFDDGKYYIFEASNGKFYFSQHCPSRDRVRVVNTAVAKPMVVAEPVVGDELDGDELDGDELDVDQSDVVVEPVVKLTVKIPKPTMRIMVPISDPLAYIQLPKKIV